MLKNTATHYGLIAKGFHGVMTLLILFQIGWGVWMTELHLYHPQYHSAPALHKSVGVIILLMAMARLAWRIIDPPPPHVATLKPWERTLASRVTFLFYLLFLVTPVFGYLVSTADGHGFSLFGLVDIPALLPAEKGREDWAGEVHETLAFSLAVLIVLHVAAALKHKIIDKDDTMKRMFGR